MGWFVRWIMNHTKCIWCFYMINIVTCQMFLFMGLYINRCKQRCVWMRLVMVACHSWSSRVLAVPEISPGIGLCSVQTHPYAKRGVGQPLSLACIKRDIQSLVGTTSQTDAGKWNCPAGLKPRHLSTSEMATFVSVSFDLSPIKTVSSVAVCSLRLCAGLVGFALLVQRKFVHLSFQCFHWSCENRASVEGHLINDGGDHFNILWGLCFVYYWLIISDCVKGVESLVTCSMYGSSWLL